MQPRRALIALALAVLLPVAAAGCGRRVAELAPLVAAPLTVASAVAAPFPGAPLGDDEHTVGAPVVVDDVTVFPIYARQQEDLGDFTTLERALADGVASVTEVGGAEEGAGEGVAAPIAQTRRGRGPQGVAQGRAQGASDVPGQVNRLAITNGGERPILVLAGTIVKGGKQDRQIGDDVVVEPKSSVKVAAYCVEPHRWTAARDGKATGGKFEAAKTMAPSKVRGKGQYDNDQSAVWSEVGKANAAKGKAPATGTLLATLDDEAETSKREARARALLARLGEAPRPEAIVGFAWGVRGEVRGARWFAHAKIWALYRDALIATAAGEGRGGEGAGRGDAGATAAPPARCTEAAVIAFVRPALAAAPAPHETEGANRIQVREAKEAWGSSLELKEGKSFAKAKPGAPKGGGAKKPLTSDFLKK